MNPAMARKVVLAAPASKERGKTGAIAGDSRVLATGGEAEGVPDGARQRSLVGETFGERRGPGSEDDAGNGDESERQGAYERGGRAFVRGNIEQAGHHGRSEHQRAVNEERRQMCRRPRVRLGVAGGHATRNRDEDDDERG